MCSCFYLGCHLLLPTCHRLRAVDRGRRELQLWLLPELQPLLREWKVTPLRSAACPPTSLHVHPFNQRATGRAHLSPSRISVLCFRQIPYKSSGLFQNLDRSYKRDDGGLYPRTDFRAQYTRNGCFAVFVYGILPVPGMRDINDAVRCLFHLRYVVLSTIAVGSQK